MRQICKHRSKAGCPVSQFISKMDSLYNTGAVRAVTPSTGGPIRTPVTSQPRPPAPRPSLTATSHVSPGAPNTVGERLDVIRESMIAQRELQRKLGENCSGSWVRLAEV